MRIRSLMCVLAFSAFSTFLAPLAGAADQPAEQSINPVAATVNGQAVKRTRLDLIAKDVQEAGNKPNTRLILDNLIRNELLAQEAVRLGIDRQPDFADREETRRKELLAMLLIRDHQQKNPISEEVLKAEYEKFKKSLGDKEYSARHIQVQTEAEAKDIIAQLVKGVDFAKLAKDKSRDTATREKGGQLGWFAKGNITPPLGDAAAKLQKGLYTTVPLQSQAGWHVLRLDEVRDLQPPAYDKVRNRLQQRLAMLQIQKLVDELRAKASIELSK